MHDSETFLSLGQAAKLAPGRPSANCLWRWCRRGVLSRSGERVHLQHRRIGGKIFTTAGWLDEFGQRLTEADAAHFQLAEDGAGPPPAPTSPRQRGRQRFEDHRRESIAAATGELEDAGL